MFPESLLATELREGDCLRGKIYINYENLLCRDVLLCFISADDIDSLNQPAGSGCALDEPPAGLHLYIQPSLHTAHLHVFMKMTVHVRLCCGQFQLQRNIQHTNWADGLLYIYLYAFYVFTYFHYAFSIQYKLQEKSNTITYTIYDL